MKVTGIENVDCKGLSNCLNHSNIITVMKTQNLLGRGAKIWVVPRRKFGNPEFFICKTLIGN